MCDSRFEVMSLVCTFCFLLLNLNLRFPRQTCQHTLRFKRSNSTNQTTGISRAFDLRAKIFLSDFLILLILFHSVFPTLFETLFESNRTENRVRTDERRYTGCYVGCSKIWGLSKGEHSFKTTKMYNNSLHYLCILNATLYLPRS